MATLKDLNKQNIENNNLFELSEVLLERQQLATDIKKAVKEANKEAEKDLVSSLNRVQKTTLEAFKEEYNREKTVYRKLEEERANRRLANEEKLTRIRFAQLKRELQTEQDMREEMLERQYSRQLEFEEELNRVLADRAIKAGSKDAKSIEKSLAIDKTRAQSDKIAQEFLSKLPLIGVKLGEVGPTIEQQIENFKTIFSAVDAATGQRMTIAEANKTAKEKKALLKIDIQDAAKQLGQNSSVFNNLKKYSTKMKKAENALDAAKKKNKSSEEINKLQKELNDAKNNYNTEVKTASKKLGKSQKYVKKTFKEAESAEETAKRATANGWANITNALATLAKKLEATSDTIAGYKGQVDTRLYGSQQNDKFLGSYWQQMAVDMSATMMSPLIKEENLTNNVLKFVNMGIARDVQQMGMLETIKDKIATTFNTFDGTMLRLIKIQDENTTAARLGMEASLTELLNEMYETTEYLSSLAQTVRASLGEAEALMGASDAVAFEYQVQKWLGSLSSVGMSDSGVQSIATAIGQLASGDISGLTSGGASNLLVMAANNANLSISDILADGLDSSETNNLLNQMVAYLQELTNESNGNLVVQQQLAKVFGLTASDLKAATNLADSNTYLGKTGIMSALYKNTTEDIYGSMMSTLFDRAGSMYSRTSVGEMLSNVMANVEYGTAAGMANPISYITMKVADILDTFAGGIPIGYLSYMGTGYDPKTSVSNIMKAGSIGTGFALSLASMIGSSMNSGGGGFTGEGLLKMVGITNSTLKRGASTSDSGTQTIVNGNVDDMTSSATSESSDEAKAKTAEASEEGTEVTNKTINESIISIYNLLDAVTNGTKKLDVNIASSDFGALLNGQGAFGSGIGV